VLTGFLGKLLGALSRDGIGRLVNVQKIEHCLDRHGRWHGISTEKLLRTRGWFNRHGTGLGFWGRLISGIHALISVPAGIELMPLRALADLDHRRKPALDPAAQSGGLWPRLPSVNVEVWLNPLI
jgi:membrane protein DedA with SNARE-associated domain